MVNIEIDKAIDNALNDIHLDVIWLSSAIRVLDVCVNKIDYSSRQEAIDNTNKKSLGQQRPYKCNTCFNWHTTTENTL